MGMRWNGQGARVPRVLVADPQPLFVDGMAALLSARGYEVVARAHAGDEAALALEDTEIAIAIVASDIADAEVQAAVADARRRRRPVALVILAPDANQCGIDTLIAAGIDGLVLKDGSSEWLFHCLASVNTGKSWLDPRALAESRQRREQSSVSGTLTRRETEIARHVASGRRNRDIAQVLGISEGTVKMHLHNTYAKLGVESRTQLAMDARIRSLA